MKAFFAWLAVAILASGCSSHPPQVNTDGYMFETRDGAVTFSSRPSDDVSRISPEAIVRWTDLPSYARAQSVSDTRDAINRVSTSTRAMLIVSGTFDVDAARQALKVLRTKARHYVVRFQVTDEQEFIRLSEMYDTSFQEVARATGHDPRQWLRKGYELRPAGPNAIFIESFE